MYIDSINFMPIDGDQTIAKQFRAACEDILMEAQVDMVLAGHHHSYQRSCPVYKEECQEPVEGQYAGTQNILSLILCISASNWR